jgi:hypothetical protein
MQFQATKIASEQMALAHLQDIGYWKAEVVATDLARSEDGILSVIPAPISLFELTFGSVFSSSQRTHSHPLGRTRVLRSPL